MLKQVENFRKSFHILSDTPAVLNKLLELAGKITAGGKQIHDMNIVATMLVNDIEEILTNNIADFARYHPYIRLIPLTEKTE